MERGLQPEPVLFVALFKACAAMGSPESLQLANTARPELEALWHLCNAEAKHRSRM